MMTSLLFWFCLSATLLLRVTGKSANDDKPTQQSHRLLKDLWIRSLPGKIVSKSPNLAKRIRLSEEDFIVPSTTSSNSKKPRNKKKKAAAKNKRLQERFRIQSRSETKARPTFSLLLASSVLAKSQLILSEIHDHFDGFGILVNKQLDNILAKLDNPTKLELVGVGSGIIASIPVLAECLARLGWVNFEKIEYPIPQLQSTNVLELTIVFHGAMSPANDEALQSMVQVLESKSKSKNSVLVMDWSKYSTRNFLPRASFHAQAIGKQFAKNMLSSIQLQHQHLHQTSYFYQPDRPPPPLQVRLHVVGVSVGAFAADAFVTNLRCQLKKEEKKERLDGSSISKSTIDCYIQETLLDPYCARGVLDLDYGVRCFGAKADYAQQIVSRTDRVPTSNEYLKNCVVWDITEQLPSRIASLLRHAEWPVLWYSTMAHKQRHRNTAVEDNKKAGGEETNSNTFVRLPLGFVPPKDQLEPGEIVIL